MTLRRGLYVVTLGVLGLSLLPVLCVLVAVTITSVAGCDLDQGGNHPCLIWGSDWGEALYMLAMMGWFGLMTLPFAALSALGLMILVLFDLIRLFRR